VKPTKAQKREKRLEHARRIADNRWWPGLHSRWEMAGRLALVSPGPTVTYLSQPGKAESCGPS
jgi:hypothetical protein